MGPCWPIFHGRLPLVSGWAGRVPIWGFIFSATPATGNPGTHETEAFGGIQFSPSRQKQWFSMRAPVAVASKEMAMKSPWFIKFIS